LTAIEIPSGVASDKSLNYRPAVIKVIIGVNNTILWVQHDPGSAHTVTSASTPAGASPFDSGDLSQGQSFVQNLTVQGTYQYHCKYHPWMSGTIVVVSGGA
jgi:plastocyanin